MGFDGPCVWELFEWWRTAQQRAWLLLHVHEARSKSDGCCLPCCASRRRTKRIGMWIQWMDKASVLNDAIKYLKQLQDQVKGLEDELRQRLVEAAVLNKKSQISIDDDDVSSCDENFLGGEAGTLPEIEARVSDHTVLARIYCENRKGALNTTLYEVERIGLTIMNTNVLPFTTSSIDITIMATVSQLLTIMPCCSCSVIRQSLSSLLTAQRLQPLVTDPRQLLGNRHYVGYHNGSFVHATLLKLQFDKCKIKVFSTPEEYAKALRAGSKHEGVSTIFDEIPYLNAFITHYEKEFQIVNPSVDRTDGFDFDFLIGYPLVPDLSKAILNLREGPEGSEIENK